MTPETLEAICTVFYGEGWKPKLAAALEVNERTVRRWATGQNEIPEWVSEQLPACAQKRIEEINDALTWRD